MNKTVTMFFGQVIKPGAEEKLNVEQDPVRLVNIALDTGTNAKVYLKTCNGESLVGILNQNKRRHKINYILDDADQATIRVVGDGNVHLVGFVEEMEDSFSDRGSTDTGSSAYSSDDSDEATETVEERRERRNENNRRSRMDTFRATRRGRF